MKIIIPLIILMLSLDLHCASIGSVKGWIINRTDVDLKEIVLTDSVAYHGDKIVHVDYMYKRSQHRGIIYSEKKISVNEDGTFYLPSKFFMYPLLRPYLTRQLTFQKNKETPYLYSGYYYSRAEDIPTKYTLLKKKLVLDLDETGLNNLVKCGEIAGYKDENIHLSYSYELENGIKTGPPERLRSGIKRYTMNHIIRNKGKLEIANDLMVIPEIKIPNKNNNRIVEIVEIRIVPKGEKWASYGENVLFYTCRFYRNYANFQEPSRVTLHEKKKGYLQDFYNSALTKAIWQKEPDIVARLLELGADPNHTDGLNRRLLYRAIDKNNYYVVKSMVKYNADLNTEISDNRTPLDAAIMKYSAMKTDRSGTYRREDWVEAGKILDLLIASGAAKSFYSKNYVVFSAIKCARLYVLKYLVEKNNINLKTYISMDNRTALQYIKDEKHRNTRFDPGIESYVLEKSK